MKRPTLLLAVVLLVLAGAGVFLLFGGDSDERIINENLAQIVELTRKQQGESVFVTLGDSRAIMKFISAQPRFDFGSRLPEITDRDDLEGMIIQARQTIHSLDLRIGKQQLTIAEDGRTAQMEIEVIGDGSYFDGSGRDRRTFSVEWIKEDGDWLVQTVRHHGNLIP